jgi:hypothetical protein
MRGTACSDDMSASTVPGTGGDCGSAPRVPRSYCWPGYRALAAIWAQDHAALTRDPVTTATGDATATVGVDARIVEVARLMRVAGDDAVVVVNGTRPAGRHRDRNRSGRPALRLSIGGRS